MIGSPNTADGEICGNVTRRVLCPTSSIAATVGRHCFRVDGIHECLWPAALTCQYCWLLPFITWPLGFLPLSGRTYISCWYKHWPYRWWLLRGLVLCSLPPEQDLVSQSWDQSLLTIAFDMNSRSFEEWRCGKYSSFFLLYIPFFSVFFLGFSYCFSLCFPCYGVSC
jgi:hypothetical protein